MQMSHEYRVIHRLGEQYATPVRFLDLLSAEKYLEVTKESTRQLGLTDLVEGWYIESRTITQWEEMK